MRRTLALVGFLALGVFLLVNPVTGLLAPSAEDPTDAATVATTLPTTTTAAPPDGTETTSVMTAATTTTTTTIAAAELVIDGPQVWSEWGYFQVQITVVDGVMTDAALIKQPSDRKSVRINDSAVPRYVSQALELQSTDFDVISGATFTWRYFRESLAGALEIVGITPAVSA